MERPTATRAILAGFVATVGMGVLTYAAPMMGMPKMDVAAMLGSMASQGMAAPGSGAWWMGMLAHVINGTIIFPLMGVIGSLIGHAAYGALLGGIAGTGVVRASRATSGPHGEIVR